MLHAVFALLAIAQSHAPRDVPPGHWAYKAVDDLFAAGLLRGYPEASLRLNAIPPDGKWLLGRIARWKQQGLFVGYPEGMSKYPIRWDKPYEQAVAIHAVWMTLLNRLEDAKRSPADRKADLGDFGDLSKAISMRAPELTNMWGDPRAMIAELDYIRSREWGTLLFRG